MSRTAFRLDSARAIFRRRPADAKGAENARFIPLYPTRSRPIPSKTVAIFPEIPDSNTFCQLTSTIERYLTESGTTPSRFGRDAMGDPGFVTALRNGRQPRDTTVRRIAGFIQAARAAR